MSVLEFLVPLFKRSLSNTAVVLSAGALLALSAIPAVAQWTTNGNNINNTNSGNVGVGTPSPTSRLTVVGPVQNGVYTVQIDSTAGGQAGAQNGILLIGTAATTYLTAGATSINGTAPHLNINGSDNTNFTATLGNTGGFGRVLRLRSSSGSSIPVIQVEGSNGGTVSFSAFASGNVGIGTGSPNASYKLDVQGGSVNASGGLCIAGDCKTAWSQVGGGTSQWTTTGANIFFSSGNVGVGTNTPTTKLHVIGDGTITGNLSVSGNLAAKYQDVAEWVESSQELQPGTVVVLDTTKSNQVLASTQSYDSRVAGVISLRPGLALGEQKDGSVLVATTGRVKVKVDASHGPVQIGDLLVTSEKEGVAMKSVPVEVGGVRLHRPGTLIGKALEPLANGTGEILVLLSMQ
jgi:hypothetical protein